MYKVEKIYLYPIFFWISVIMLTIGIKVDESGMVGFFSFGALIYGLLTIWCYNEANEPQSTFWFVSIIFILFEIYVLFFI